MDWTIRFKNSANKELAKLPRRTVQRIRAAIDQLATNPRPHGSKKMKGEENQYRIRIGDYRVVYEIHEKEVLVLIVRIGHRKDVYE